MTGKKCKICSTTRKTVYHYGRCPQDRDDELFVWVKNKERPIEQADRFLRQYGLEKDGAKGWI